VEINGERHYLWRAVDHEGEVLETVVTKRRNREAALKFLRKLMRRYGRFERIVTERFPSYRAALRDLGGSDLQSDGASADLRHRPFLRPRSLQPGTQPLQQEHLQSQSRHRTCRVASARHGRKHPGNVVT